MGTGACWPWPITALAADESMDISPLAAASAPSDTFASFFPAPVFGANLSFGCVCRVWVCPASLDPARAFWLRNAVWLSRALVKAQNSIVLRIDFLPLRFQGDIPRLSLRRRQRSTA